MKKLLIGLSFVCFCIAIVCKWVAGGFITGLVFTLIYGVGIVACIWAFKKRRSINWWIILLIAIFAVISLGKGINMLDAKRAQERINSVSTENESENDSDAISDKVTDKNEKSNKEKVTTQDDDSDSDAAEMSSKDVQENEDVEEVAPSTRSTEQNESEPIVVEKIVEKKVEVPVEKVVEKTVTEYVEVPVVEYVEVEVPTPTIDTESSTTVTVPETYSTYTGDPTVYGDSRYGYNGYVYTGDPTAGNYGYGYTGDPTTGGNYYGSLSISGARTVVMGETIKYTISGVSRISENNLNLPKNVYVDKISGNKVYLIFEEVGWYSIGYGNATISVEVEAN